MRYLIFLVFLLSSGITRAQTWWLTGDWSSSVSSGTLSEAGNDYSGSISSASNQILVSFYNLINNRTYLVYAYRVDSQWDSGLTLSVERTGIGTPSGISNPDITYVGGSPPIQITSTNSLLWYITNRRGRNIANIPMQYTISGISVLRPARTYSTTVYYTAYQQ